MAEPPQPRKYNTRARAKAENPSADGKPSHTLKASIQEPTLASRPMKARRTVATVSDGTAKGAAGINMPPKRRGARIGGVAAKNPPKTTAARGGKKVTFAGPVEFEDKENLAPPRQQQRTKSNRTEADYTDVVMSNSIGALSVKPKRIPASKLKQPSVSATLEPLPALSPSKARRAPVKASDEDDMEDELASPSSPILQLSIQPKRIALPIGQSFSSVNLFLDAATNLTKPNNLLDPTASLIGSPAKRPITSSFKPRRDDEISADSITLPAQTSSNPGQASILASPARRPVTTKHYPNINQFQKLQPRTEQDIETAESFAQNGLMSPPKRPKTFRLDQDYESQLSDDELGIDFKVARPKVSLFGKKQIDELRPVKKHVKPEIAARFSKFEFADAVSNKENNMDEDHMMTQEDLDEIDRKVASLIVPLPYFSTTTTPPTPPGIEPINLGVSNVEKHNPVSPTLSEKAVIDAENAKASEIDIDGDISMDDTEGSCSAPDATPTPTPRVATTKHKSPSEGGSSYGFFNLGDDDEDELKENIFRSYTTEQTARKSLFPPVQESRYFGQELNPSDSDDIFGGIPIDPMLLGVQTIDPAYLGSVESSARTTTIALKLPPIGDEDENMEDQENRPHSQAEISRKIKDETIAGAQKRQSASSDANTSRRRSTIGKDNGVLAGAVIYVDVHTADGANASTTFEEVLRQLGAKVLKSWNWNPDANAPAEKIGITHVVFKDGSPRTLQKVKESKGVVLCVGVAWVSECEREQTWVDEAAFAVDLDFIPRGGHRRRKSMEPKALTALTLNLQDASNGTYDSAICQNGGSSQPPKTPKLAFADIPILFYPKTAPPKNDELSDNPVLMQRLLVARRKSLQFAPKIGSPLARKPLVADE